MAKTKITVLCENTPGRHMGIAGEHGFSALVETGGGRLLFDTGQGMTLRNNAQSLRIDLASLQTLVLSHGHYDHTGGLAEFLNPPRGVEIIAHPDVFDAKYAEIAAPQGKDRVFVGTKFSREYLEGGLKCRFRFTREFAEISPGIFFSGEVPVRTDFEKPDPRLVVRRGDLFEPDPLRDDASLLIETNRSPVVLLGCAHAGTVNVLRYFAEKTGHRKFHALIGGTHLGAHGEGEQLERTMDAFDEFGIDIIAVSHCTGLQAACTMSRRFPGRFAFANASWEAAFD